MAERRIFTKNIDGQEAVQVAYTPADIVRLTFDGWRERQPEPPAPTAASAKTTAKTTAK